MKLIKMRADVTADELLAMLKNSEETNKGVRFDDKKGTPEMKLTERQGKIKIGCEFVGGATKDNAFISGTKFSGKIVEKNGGCEIRGIITTAPIFHFVLFLMFAVFIVMCIVNRGFNAVPICLIVFDIFMYKDEFRKQGIIERYIARAVKRAEKKEK